MGHAALDFCTAQDWGDSSPEHELADAPGSGSGQEVPEDVEATLHMSILVKSYLCEYIYIYYKELRRAIALVYAYIYVI